MRVKHFMVELSRIYIVYQNIQAAKQKKRCAQHDVIVTEIEQMGVYSLHFYSSMLWFFCILHTIADNLQ